jgi:DNA-binding NarL/FixJ family response regulator
VLGGTSGGHTNVEIADEIGYSANTTKTCVGTITERLGASDRSQAAVHAAETGLFSP